MSYAVRMRRNRYKVGSVQIGQVVLSGFQGESTDFVINTNGALSQVGGSVSNFSVQDQNLNLIANQYLESSPVGLNWYVYIESITPPAGSSNVGNFGVWQRIDSTRVYTHNRPAGTGTYSYSLTTWISPIPSFSASYRFTLYFIKNYLGG